MLKSAYAIHTVLLGILLPLFSAQAVVISSECDDETFAFYLKFIGGGVDDLNGNTSWSKAVSEGWFRIGPFKDLTMGGEWLAARITCKGVPLTRWDSTDKNVIFGCHHPTNGETYKIDTNSNSDTVKTCLKQGGSWVPFEKISIYGKYTLKGCDGFGQPDPEVVRYHWTDGGMHFVPMSGKTWHMVTSGDTRMWEVFRDKNAIILERSEGGKMYFMLKDDGVFTKNQLSDPSWSRLANGGWKL